MGHSAKRGGVYNALQTSLQNMNDYNPAKSSEFWRRSFKTVWRARLCGGKMERTLKVAKITGWKIPSKIILLFHFMLMFNSSVLDNKCLFFQSHLKINGVSQGGLHLFIMLGGSFSNTYFCTSLPASMFVTHSTLHIWTNNRARHWWRVSGNSNLW